LKKIFLLLTLLSCSLLANNDAFFNLSLGNASTPEQLSEILNVSVLLTFLFLAPTLLMMMTSFTRFIIVFSLLKQAIGLQQMPPSKIIVGISLIMTIFVMKPYAINSYENGIKPYMDKSISFEESFEKTVKPFRDFMLKNTRESDLALFYRISKEKNPSIKDVSLTTLMPAFVVSELKTAFEIGLLLFIPFVIIDIIVSVVLMSLGMMMLPPSMISMPIKIGFFVLIDGWALLIGQLTQSFN
jgi:flagellar biosynthesis protein FliP